MTNVVPLVKSKDAGSSTIRIGLLKLTDAAPVIAAHELGYFREAGVHADLSIEPSWANIADKLTYGLLDAAVIVPPLAFAIALGLRGPARRLIVPMSLSLGGNTVTLKSSLAKAVLGSTKKRDAQTLAQGLANRRLGAESKPPVLGIVHAFSTHNLLLRYWLASGGADPERDVVLRVVPPARMVEALTAGEIDGFCAGAPWGALAEREGVGLTVTTSHGIWQHAPEKALAMNESWASQKPEALQSVLAALLRACQYCDRPENASSVASLLAKPAYLDIEANLIAGSLPMLANSDADSSRRSAFFRGAATFPWRSHAHWFLGQMQRWGFVRSDLDAHAVAKTVYRPDLYAQAADGMDVSVPVSDTKVEGAHHAPWQIAGSLGPIEMGPDRFCDSAVFESGRIRRGAPLTAP